MSPFNQQKEELSDSSKNLFCSRPFSNDNLRKNFHTIVSNSSGNYIDYDKMYISNLFSLLPHYL